MRATISFINRTIDDVHGDSDTGRVPAYNPPTEWQQGASCSICNVRLDTREVFDGTWHDTTQHSGDSLPRSIEVTFEGIAVYMYNALANHVPGADTITDLTFHLDGALAGRFLHVPNNITEYEYHVPVFAKENLPDAEHNLIITATPGSTSLILFDYIVYTVVESDPLSPMLTSAVLSVTSQASQGSRISPGSTVIRTQTPHRTGLPSFPSDTALPTSGRTSMPIGSVAGGAVGGICAMLIIAGAILYVRKRYAGCSRVSSADRKTVFLIDEDRSTIPPQSPIRHNQYLLARRTSSELATRSDSAPQSTMRPPRSLTLAKSGREQVTTVPRSSGSVFAERPLRSQGAMRSIDQRSGSGPLRQRESGLQAIHSVTRVIPTAGSQSRSRPGTTSSVPIREELALLRAENAMLRANLEIDERLREAAEGLPPYSK